MSIMHIKKIDVLSMGKIFAIIFAVLFEILVIIFMIPTSLVGIGNSELALIAGVILLAPLIYGAFGFVTGVIIALVANVVCKLVN